MALSCTPCSLPPTQSQKEVDWSQSDVNISQVWGWLYPCRLHLKTFEISSESITVGRATDCDIVLSAENLTPNVLKIVSKKHMKIYRHYDESSTVVYLEDTSFNGTYINGVKLGRGNRALLQNEDEISIGHPGMKAYVFKCSYENSDMPKEITSKYVVSKLLGTGACGEVKLVWDKHTCKKYAMKKIIKSKFTATTKVAGFNDPKRIMNEISILKSLDHPFVIHMEDIIDTDSAVYIILELMEGGELFDRIVNATRIPEHEAKFIFYQIVSAVNYLHEQGISHRDLKPENILLSSNGPDTLVKISDFGLSKFIAEETVLRTVCGTPMYVAPEILLTKGRGTYTKQVDVWSLGIILYVLLSGHFPFSQDDPKLTLSEQIISGEYTFPQHIFQGVSKNAIDLVKRILVVNPEKRLNAEGVLNHGWFDDSQMIAKIKHILGEDNTLTSIDLNLEDYEPCSKRIKFE